MAGDIAGDVAGDIAGDVAGDVVIWRHPLPRGVAGRCIGRLDVPVDARKAKRLAHRIRHRARRERWPPVIWTSPLQRGRAVGRWLARWGWTHHVDERLSELNFGDWDGRAWSSIGANAVDEWCADFAHHAPGGGESVADLLRRCRAFVDGLPAGSVTLIVGHAGWISAARWALAHDAPPVDAARWPASVAYASETVLRARGALPSSG